MKKRIFGWTLSALGLLSVCTYVCIILNNMNPVRTMRFERHNRISQGHKITVKYAFSLTV